MIVATSAGTRYVIECEDSAVADKVTQSVDVAEGWTFQEAAEIISLSTWWRLSRVAVAGNPQPSPAPAD